mmetsp:Transcript_42369/g.92138  ORF Transcript_42369/g.92138 Transcript_42369/m.92138 type:complete len:255 (-) Transcript_42369:642-1406(-)
MHPLGKVELSRVKVGLPELVDAVVVGHLGPHLGAHKRPEEGAHGLDGEARVQDDKLLHVLLVLSLEELVDLFDPGEGGLVAVLDAAVDVHDGVVPVHDRVEREDQEHDHLLQIDRLGREVLADEHDDGPTFGVDARGVDEVEPFHSGQVLGLRPAEIPVVLPLQQCCLQDWVGTCCSTRCVLIVLHLCPGRPFVVVVVGTHNGCHVPVLLRVWVLADQSRERPNSDVTLWVDGGAHCVTNVFRQLGNGTGLLLH